MSRPLRLALALCLALCACPSGEKTPKGTVLLYDVEFSAPEQTVGSEVKTVEPSGETPFPTKFPTRVFFGQPTVVTQLCGLDKQPAKLSVATGTNGIEGLEFLLDQRYGHYRIEVDVCVDHIDQAPLPAQDVQVAVFLDIAEAHALGFVSGGDIVVIDPNLPPDSMTTKPLAKFALGKPMHLAFDVDIEKRAWHAAVDGKTVYDGPLVVAIPRAIRFLVRGNPLTVAGFDNLWIWADHDLTREGQTPSSPNVEREQ
jgi:hypothetical protein